MAYLPQNKVSIFSGIPSSVLVGASVFGNVGISGTPNVNTAGSVISFQSNPSVMQVLAGLMSTNASIIAILGNTSVLTVNPISSVKAWNAPIASWVSGIADLRGNTGASVAVIAGQGGVISTYITGVQVANYGPSSVLVTFAGNSQGGSILGYTIAPAGGGSNIVYPNALITGGNQPFTASINAVASVLISAQGFTS